jgi:WD40 repeat protein
MESHSEGETWGLAIVGSEAVVTSGDDNQLKLWNTSNGTCTATTIISNENRKAKRGGASTLSDLPDSKCARSLAYNPASGHVAVAHNDGTLSIRSSP